MKLRTVYRNGNGLVFSIPPHMAAALKLTAGSQVAVALSNQSLVVQRAVVLGASDLRDAGARKESSRD